MRLTNLSDPILLLEQHINNSRRLLRESCDGLSIEQRIIVEGIYNEFVPLIEASLTADQIKQIFGAVEKQAVAGGQSRTLVGAGVDVAKQANDAINKMGQWLQNTAPVKNFDQKFDNLKATVSQKFPDLANKLSSMGDWARENPGKTAAIIGIMTTLGSLAGGPVGGAIAGQILRGATELLKGEKLSTAIGKGLKTAAIGWLAGMTMDAVGDMISDVYQQFNPIPLQGNASYSVINVGNGLPSTFQDAAIYGNQEQLDQFTKLWRYAADNWRNGDYAAAEEAFESAKEFASQVSLETLNKIAIEGDPAEKVRALTQALDGFSAAAQGAAAGATAYDKQGKPVEGSAPAKKESRYLQQRPLSEGQIYLMFDQIQRLDEGPLDMLKKAGSAVAKGASWVGKQATEKLTSAKLFASWKLAGSPTDSAELAKFLKDEEVPDEIVKKVYADMKISDQPAQENPAAQSLYAQVKTDLEKVDKKGKQRLMAYLQKQLGTA